jgi:phosphate starvation-inducible protein PhoH
MKKHKQAMEDRTEQRAIEQIADSTATDKLYSQLDADQRDFDKKLDQHSVVFVDAEAGTGKTAVAVRKAVEMLRQNKVSRIVYVRFPDKKGGSLGFLTGDKGAKESGYMVPFMQAMAKCGVQPEALGILASRNTIEMTTDMFLRGTNMEGTFLIIDEAQNATDLEALKTVLTRLHDHRGKGAVIGHTKQTDNRVEVYTKHKLTAFQVTAFHFLRKPWAARAYLRTNYRGEISKWADKVDESLILLEGMEDVI